MCFHRDPAAIIAERCHHRRMLFFHRDPAAIIAECCSFIRFQQPSAQNASLPLGSSSHHRRTRLFHKDPTAILAECCSSIGIQQPSSQTIIPPSGSSSRAVRWPAGWLAGGLADCLAGRPAGCWLVAFVLVAKQLSSLVSIMLCLSSLLLLPRLP